MTRYIKTVISNSLQQFNLQKYLFLSFYIRYVFKDFSFNIFYHFAFSKYGIFYDITHFRNGAKTDRKTTLKT